MDSSNDRDWWNAQAGEYVLGTLDDTDHKVFVQLLKTENELVERVRQWEEYLQPLADAIPAQSVSPTVWKKIAQELGLDEEIPTQSVVIKPGADSLSAKDDHTRIVDINRAGQEKNSNRLARWQRAAVLSMVATFLLAVVLIEKVYRNIPAVENDGLQSISLVQNENTETLWLVNVLSSSSAIQVIALSPPPIASDRVHQLWMVKADDQGVTSLGLLPTVAGASMTLPVSKSTHDLLASAVALAVSLEPAGGSPEAAPTGPVLFQAEITKVQAL